MKRRSASVSIATSSPRKQRRGEVTRVSRSAKRFEVVDGADASLEIIRKCSGCRQQCSGYYYLAQSENKESPLPIKTLRPEPFNNATMNIAHEQHTSMGTTHS